MTDKELIEQLAHFEHASWAHWMEYLFEVCPVNNDGSHTIPWLLAERWQRQIATSYSDLTEREKDSDRAEVKLIMPVIKEWAKGKK